MDGLPFGTRGGTLIKHQFPQDAEYVFSFNLANTTAGADLDVMLDGERIKQFNIARGGRAVDVYLRSDTGQLATLVDMVDAGELRVDVGERLPLAQPPAAPET